MSEDEQSENEKAARTNYAKVKRRSQPGIVDGTETGKRPDGKNVTAGWAMGKFYDASTELAHSTDFEIKLWQQYDKQTLRSEQPACLNPDWFAHDHGGPEFILVISGVLDIQFGYLAGDQIKVFETARIEPGHTIVLPEGLYRRFSSDGAVSAITVRRGH